MSGFETLAQVYREIAYPKMKNLKITANHRLLLRHVLYRTHHAVCGHDHPRCRPQELLRQPDRRPGDESCRPSLLRLGFHIFVVIVGVLILSGAVNTSTDRRERGAEPGRGRRRTCWIGFANRITASAPRIASSISITILQMATIILSRGDVYLLGEAYAFGVVWSFVLEGLGVLALRYQRHDQEYKFPVNIHIGKTRNSRRPGHHDPRF